MKKTPKTKKCDCGERLSLDYKKAEIRTMFNSLGIVEMWTWVCGNCGQVWAKELNQPKRV